MEKRDFSAVQNMEFNLVQKARECCSSSEHLISDLSSALFPRSNVFLSDRLLSNCLQYLRSIIGEIESQLCLKASENLGVSHASIEEIGNNSYVYSFDHMRDSGLLNKPNVLRFVFTQAQKVELTNRLLQKVSQEELENSLSNHLDHENEAIADAAMALLVSKNKTGLQIGQKGCRLSDVPGEVYHELLWSVTAAVQKVSGCFDNKMLTAAELLLSDHDESQSSDNRALRLARLLENRAENSSIPHPLKDGPDLFLARFAHRSGLRPDQLVMFTAEPNMVRFVIVMRALDVPVEQAVSIFTALNGSGSLLTGASYQEVSQADARLLTEKWSNPDPFREAEMALHSLQQNIDR